MSDLHCIIEKIKKRSWSEKDGLKFTKRFNPSYSTTLLVEDGDKIKLTIIEVYGVTEKIRKIESRPLKYMVKRIDEILNEIEENDDLLNKKSIEYSNWLLAKENYWDFRYAPGKMERAYYAGGIFASFTKFNGEENLQINIERQEKEIILRYSYGNNENMFKFDDLKEMNRRLSSLLNPS